MKYQKNKLGSAPQLVVATFSPTQLDAEYNNNNSLRMKTILIILLSN